MHYVNTKRTTILHALPIYLHEEVSRFFRAHIDIERDPACIKIATIIHLINVNCESSPFTFLKDEMDEPEMGDASVVLLATTSDDSSNPVHYEPQKITVILKSDGLLSSQDLLMPSW